MVAQPKMLWSPRHVYYDKSTGDIYITTIAGGGKMTGDAPATR